MDHSLKGLKGMVVRDGDTVSSIGSAGEKQPLLGEPQRRVSVWSRIGWARTVKGVGTAICIILIVVSCKL